MPAVPISKIAHRGERWLIQVLGGRGKEYRCVVEGLLGRANVPTTLWYLHVNNRQVFEVKARWVGSSLAGFVSMVKASNCFSVICSLHIGMPCPFGRKAGDFFGSAKAFFEYCTNLQIRTNGSVTDNGIVRLRVAIGCRL